VYNHRVTSIPASKARAALPELLDRVHAGEEVTITRHGEPVAVLLRPDALRARHAGAGTVIADGLREALQTARTAPLPVTDGLTTTRAEELVAEIDAGRAAR
jgi:antitoxin (DNA-binding transcriptional repressor) of toxin-antitoxin stability system